MPDLNIVHLMGRLTFDPELRRISSGTAVTDLRTAVNRSWQGNDGERREEVAYIDVTVWGKQAENCCQFLRKGSLVFVEGYLKMDQWDDKETGQKRTKLKVQAERVHFLDGKREGGEDQGEQRRRDDYPQQQGRSQPSRGGYQEQPQQQGRGGAPQGRGGGYSGQGRQTAPPVTQYEVDNPQNDEDIPF